MTTGEQDKTNGTDAMPVGIASTDQLGVAPKRAVCAYCGKPDDGWGPIELRHGYRWDGGVLTYHCYDAYCMD